MEIMSRRTPDHPLFYQKKEMEGEEDDLHADAGPLETFCQNPYSREGKVEPSPVNTKNVF